MDAVNESARPKGRAVRFLLAVAPGAVSALLLVLAYSPVGWGWLAWAALGPVYVALVGRAAGGAGRPPDFALSPGLRALSPGPSPNVRSFLAWGRGAWKGTRARVGAKQQPSGATGTPPLFLGEGTGERASGPGERVNGGARGAWARAALAGYAFGFVLFLVGAYWMIEIGSVPWVCLSLIEAWPFALLALACALVLPRLPAWARPWAFAAFWTLSEAARAAGPYAFPWFQLATTQVRGSLPVLGIVSVTGQWGLALGIAAVNGLLGEAWLAWRGRASRDRIAAFAIGAAALMTALFAWGVFQDARVGSSDVSSRKEDRRTIGIAQGAFDKGYYGDADARAQVLAGYLDLTRDAVRQGGGDEKDADGRPQGIALTLWPETVAPGVYSQSPVMQEALSGIARETRTPLLAGVYDLDSEDRAWNSAVLYGADGAFRQRYDKQQIVPIGEFFPLRSVLGPIYAQYGVPPRDLSSGSRPGVLDAGGDRPMRVGTLICYECVFPRWAREETRQGAEVLVLLTSDETFGTTAGPIQHADIAILRAVETDRWLVRAAATGVSEFIDPRGVVHESLPLVRRGALAGRVTLRHDVTPYVRYGDWFLWVCGGLSALAVAAAFSGARRSAPPAAPGSASG